jgi:dTDP-4-dehydrorhamnose reductase
MTNNIHDDMEKSKILVIGEGFLGSHLISELKKQGFQTYGAGFTNKNTSFNVDIRNIESVKNLFTKIQPNIVINCAALTDLDYLENNPKIAFDVNSEGPKNLAITCNEKNFRLIHISSDGIFDGKSQNYNEDSLPNPINVYGKSKFQGEIHVQQNMQNYLILRTNFFGHDQNRNNLFTWIFNSLKNHKQIIGFNDVFFNPLELSTLSQLISKVLFLSDTGILNLSNDIVISKYEFALKIAHVFNFDIQLIKKGTIKDIDFIAKRPLNTSLSNKKVSNLLKSKIPSYEESFTMINKKIQ